MVLAAAVLAVQPFDSFPLLVVGQRQTNGAAQRAPAAVTPGGALISTFQQFVTEVTGTAAPLIVISIKIGRRPSI